MYLLCISSCGVLHYQVCQYFCVSRRLVGYVKSKKYHVAVFVYRYSYRPGFVQTEFKTSGTHMFVSWRATERSLELWQSALPAVSFTCAPFAVLMAACSRGESV